MTTAAARLHTLHKTQDDPADDNSERRPRSRVGGQTPVESPYPDSLPGYSSPSAVLVALHH